MEKFQVVLERLYGLFVQYGMKFLLAVVVLIAGLIVIRWITRALVKMMKKGNVNASLIPFLRSMTNILLKVPNAGTITFSKGRRTGPSTVSFCPGLTKMTKTTKIWDT